MKTYVTSGSAIERAMNCIASVALPHADHTSVDSDRGTVLHEFLEDIPKVGLERALTGVPAEWREACEALNLEGLDHVLAGGGGGAEIALAFDCESGAVRELGRGRGRAYGDVRPSEIPATLDVVRIAIVGGRRIGLVIDWKTGWTMRGKKVSGNWQLDFGALLVMRAFECDEVNVQLIHVGELVKPWTSRGLLTSTDADLVAEEVQELYRRALPLRVAAEERGQIPARSNFRMGVWCDYCPAKRFCPPQMTLIRAVSSGDEFDELMRITPIPDGQLAEAWRRLRFAKKIVSMLEAAIKAAASDHMIDLGEDADGLHHWLGPVVVEGKELLAGDVVYNAIIDAAAAGDLVLDGPAEELAEGIAEAATKLTATKKDLEAAIRAVTPKGKGAANLRAVLELVRARDGATRTVKIEPREIVTKDASPPPVPRMLPGPSGSEGGPADD